MKITNDSNSAWCKWVKGWLRQRQTERAIEESRQRYIKQYGAAQAAMA